MDWGYVRVNVYGSFSTSLLNKIRVRCEGGKVFFHDPRSDEMFNFALSWNYIVIVVDGMKKFC